MQKEAKKICIVGGGIGGMMSALILERAGYTVTLLERTAQLGGRLSYRGNGTYKIDRGPTIMLLPHLHRKIFTLAGLDFDELTIERCDPALTIDFQDGKTFTKWSDSDQQLAYLAKHYPESFIGFEHYLTDLRDVYARGERYVLTQSFPTLFSAVQKPLWQLLRDMQVYRSTRTFLKNYFTNEHLLDAYSLQTLYIGGGPTCTPSLYGLVGFSEHEHGVWYLQGGYAGLSEYLTLKLEQRGIAIHYDTEVSQLEQVEQTVTHVVSEQGVFACDEVILNTEYPLISKLNQQKMRQYRPSNGCVTIYLGLSRQYLQKPMHSFYLPNDFAILFAKLFQKQLLPEKPAIYVFNPSRYDQTLAPKGHSSLYILVPVPSDCPTIDWDDRTFQAQFVANVLTTLEAKGFDDLRQHIQWQEVLTPADCVREGLYKGGSFGIAPTLMQSGPLRPQAHVQPFTNVYAVGASVHPGGGIPIVMQSANFACQEIMKKDGNDERKRSL